MNKLDYNKIIIGLVVAIVVAIGGITFIYFSTDENKNNLEDDKKEEILLESSTKTIMLYMVGSDLESNFGAASSDLEEISSSLPNLDDINVVIYLGGSESYYNSYVREDENVILELTEEGLVPVEEIPAKNMGSSETLSYFINYVTDSYNTDEYSLILWDHGGGPLIGYGLDETTGDILTLKEIEESLNDTEFNEDNKLGFIGFDACLMGSFEVANLLDSYTNYLMASEETIPGNGWNYSFLTDLSKDDNNVEIGKKVIDTYFDYYESRTNMYDLTLSLLDLSKIDDLNNSLNNFFGYLNSDLSVNTFAGYAKTRVKAKTFGGYSSSAQYDLVDLSNMIELTGGNSADDVIADINDLVIYNKANINNANGLTIYYPYSNKSLAVTHMSTYNSLGIINNYSSYIENFTNILVGKPIKTLDISDRSPVISETDDYDFTFTLTEEELSNFSTAGYNVFRRTEDGYYEIIYFGTDVVLEGNNLKANLRDKGVKVVTNEEESDNLVLLLYGAEDGYRKYITPVMLTNLTDDLDFTDYKMESGYLQLILYDDGRIEPLGIVPMDDFTSVAPKSLTSLDDWKTIQFLKPSYNIFDENGNYTTEWEGSGIVTGWEFHIADIKGFEKYDFSESQEEYYCIFIINDSQGNTSYSQPVLLK